MITKEQKELSDRNLRIRKLENLINQWDKENEIDFLWKHGGYEVRYDMENSKKIILKSDITR